MRFRPASLGLALVLFVLGATAISAPRGPSTARAEPVGPFVAFVPFIAADETPSAESIAKIFFDAWQAEDDETLSLYGELSVIAAAQSAAVTSGWAFSNCQGAAGSLVCTWVRPGERIRISVRNVDPPRLATGFTFAELTSQEVAQEFLDAWRAGSEEALLAISGPEATAAAVALAAQANGAWSFDRCEGAAGSLFCTWRRGTSTLVIRVANLDPPARVTEFRIEG